MSEFIPNFLALKTFLRNLVPRFPPLSDSDGGPGTPLHHVHHHAHVRDEASEELLHKVNKPTQQLLLDSVKLSSQQIVNQKGVC